MYTTTKNLIEKYNKQHGYKPSLVELYDLYNQGELVLTDTEEDNLLSDYEKAVA